MDTRYTQKDFIKYVLRRNRSLTAKGIYEDILDMPCEKTWTAKKLKNSISTECLNLYKAGILDREKINRIYVYWLR